MSHTKHHPDKQQLRLQSKRITNALKILNTVGIEIMTIDCTYAMPRIEVLHCAGVERLKAENVGKGHTLLGSYTRKMAQVRGCQVEWNEWVN